MKLTRLQPVTLAATLVGLLFTASCTYDKAEAPPPCVLDDPAAVHYSTDIQPLLAAHCYECHSKENSLILGGGHNWENFTEFQAYAKSGSLVGATEQKDENYKSVYMPRNNPKLPACDIERIKAWVNNGAKAD